MQAGAAERVAALQQDLAAEKQTAVAAQEASSKAAAALAEAIHDANVAEERRRK